MTQPFPDDSIERTRRYSTEEKQELERQLGEMTSTEPTQPIPPTDVDRVAAALKFASTGPYSDLALSPYRAAGIAVDALARAGRLRDATGDETRTEELERFREHSVTLNSVGRRMAVALGDVPEGADRVEGNPLEQVDRLIAELERLRGAPAPSPSIEETPRNDTA